MLKLNIYWFLLLRIEQDELINILKQQNLSRDVSVSVPHILVAPFILAQTDLIATLAKRVAENFAQTQALKILPLPVSLKGFSVLMRWYQSSQHYPEQIWLRSMIYRISKKICD